MTVETNYAITIATFSDWLKGLVPIFQPSRIEANATLKARFFFCCLSNLEEELTSSMWTLRD